MKLSNILRLVYLLCILWLATSPAELLAQNQTSPDSDDSNVYLSIRPKDLEDGARFEGTAKPGESIEFAAVVENLGTEPIEIRIYTSDIVPTINGGLTLAPSDSEKHGITLWLDFPTEEVTLQPGEGLDRSLTITVPQDAAPGQYVNAVALETVNPVQESSAFRQFFRKVVSVYVTVPGDVISDFSIGEPEVRVAEGESALLIPIQNTGNVRTMITAVVDVETADGSPIMSVSLPLGVIYMGQSTYFFAMFPTVPPAGEVIVSYTFSDQESEVVKSSEKIVVSVPEDESVLAAAPVKFEEISVEPNADPIVFANVDVTISSSQASYQSTRLTMIVSKDGEVVEDFVLADNLSIQVGTPAIISQRYLPATSWESGTYTFSLKLESIDGSSSSLLLEGKDVATLEFP